MGVTRVAGMPDYTSSGSSKFIPEIWSGKMLEKWYKATVFASISNTNYEGEIKDQGDKVIIRTVPTLTIRDYERGQKLQYERPESTATELTIDYAKYFSFVCDDIDRHQSDINVMNVWAADAAEQMKIAVDYQLLTLVTYGTAGTFPGSSSNTGTTAGAISSSFNLGTSGSPVQITKANVLEYIADCGTVLDEQNVPETGRWMVIPAWFSNLLIKSDLKDASMTGTESTLANGRLGMLYGFTLYKSNNMYSATDGSFTGYYIPFGTNHAITFASQITKMESLRAESTFGDLVRSLHVYGFKVLKTEALGLLYARK